MAPRRRRNGRHATPVVWVPSSEFVQPVADRNSHRGAGSAIGLHGPAQPGTNGAQLIDLAGKCMASPVRGSATVPAGQIQYMLLGWTDVLILTNRHPNCEIRGKVDVVPPDRPRSESGAASAGAVR